MFQIVTSRQSKPIDFFFTASTTLNSEEDGLTPSLLPERQSHYSKTVPPMTKIRKQTFHSGSG
ncbi:unnamed protein product [Malus baccata var. baccata]